GTPRVSEVNLRLLNRYFFFQVWNVYLITIFTSSIFSIATDGVKNPESIVNMIPEKVPGSSTPILTYVLLLAFTGAAKEILQIARLALRYILPLLFAKTPRKISAAETPAEFDWATSIPTHSLIFLMGFSYSFIAPIVNCFAAVYFGLFYLVYRYQFLYVYNDANWVTGGLSFPKSIKQTMVGVYISEVYMLLMMLAKVAKLDHVNANAILRIIFPALILLLTIFAHIYINDAYMPIINYLPIRGAVEIEENPRIATTFPDVTGDGDLGEDTLETDSIAAAENKVRRMLYATYGSLVPKRLIDYVLTKVPRLLSPKAKVMDEKNGHNSAPLLPLAEVNQSPLNVTDGFVPMPTAHHYNAGDNSVRPTSNDTNIMSIDSHAQAAYPPMIVEPQDPGVMSVHSITSATELRQRRTNTLPQSVHSVDQRKSRYSMVDTGPLANAGENVLAEAFSNPALRAKATICIWVPLDNCGLCNELYENVQTWGDGTIRVVTGGTWIDEKGHVRADVEFDPDDTDFIKPALRADSVQKSE
ncbi:phosphate metabolism protein 7, partial [Coemansia erecta]